MRNFYSPQLRQMLVCGLMVIFGILIGRPVSAQLSGSYTIDPGKSASSTNYTSIYAAAQDLKIGLRPDGGTANGPGVKSAVDFSIADSTYTQQIRLGNITGSSYTNTITFQSASGNAANVTLQWPTNTLTGINNNYALFLDSTDYVIFKNITIRRTGTITTAARVIHIRNGAMSNTITGCRILGCPPSVTSLNCALVYSASTKDDSNRFIGNTLKYGSDAFYYYGQSAAIKEAGTVIKNNIVDSTYYDAVYIVYQNNLLFEGNTVHNMISTIPYCVYLSYCDSNTIIRNNRLSNPAYYTLYLNNCNGYNLGLVYNNFIHSAGSTYTVAGLYINATSNFTLANNSFSVTNTLTGTRCVYAISGKGNTLFNNIFANFGGGPAIEVTAAAVTSGSIAKSDNNDFYVKGTNLGLWNGTANTTIAAWKTATSMDASSLSMDPVYVNNITNLHKTNRNLARKGVSIAAITSDIDGNARHSSPDIGADEMTLRANDIGLVSILNPVGASICGDSLTAASVILTNNGTLSQTNIPILLKDSSTSITLIRDTLKKTIAPGGTDTLYFKTRINTMAGGMHYLTFINMLSADSNHVNDTIRNVYNFTAQGPAPSVSGATRCGYGPVTLVSKPTSGFATAWYSSLTSDTIIHLGDSFITPALGASRNYYARVLSFTTQHVGPKNTSFGTGGNYTFYTDGIVFDALQDFYLDSVTVYPSTSGDIYFNVMDSLGNFITGDTQTVTVTTANAPIRVGLKLFIPKGMGYQIDAVGTTTSGLYRNTASAVYPYAIPGKVNIRRPINSLAGFYYFFYDWAVSVYGCPGKASVAIATISKGVTAKPKFVASNGCLGASTSFTDSTGKPTSGTITSWSYDFGDTTTYTSTTSGSTVHTYMYPGTYKVILTVTASSGCTDSFSRIVTVDPLPVAGFSFANVCSGVPVVFNNTGTKGLGIKNYMYDFGDSTSAGITTTVSISHTYKYGGVHKVTQTITTLNGCTDTISAYINIGQAPATPVVKGAIICGSTGGSVKLSASTPMAGAVNNWFANATTDTILYTGDTFTTPFITGTATYYVEASSTFKGFVGPANKSIGTNGAYTFYTDGLVFEALQDITIDSVTVFPSGSGNVVFNVIDSISGGSYASKTVAVTVSTSGAPIRIPIGISLPAGKYRVNAAGSTTTGGLFRNTASAVYPYVAPGMVAIRRPINSLAGFYYFFYNWQVSVQGCTSPRVPVKVFIGTGTKPVASFSATSACQGAAVSLTDKSTIGTGSIASWTYDFGDTTTAYFSKTTGNTTHTFKYYGNMKVTLTVAGSGGCVDTISQFVKINQKPKAGFSVTNPVCFGTPQNFTNTSAGATNLKYYFGNGDSSLLSSPKYTYNKSGLYTALQVAENSSCRDTFKSSITINPAPVAKIAANGYCVGNATNFADSSAISSGSIIKDAWDFGDGYSSTNANPSHSYVKAGAYTARLVVTSNLGCMDSAKTTVTISDAPMPYWSAAISGSGPALDFTAMDSASGLTYAWDFGDTTAAASGRKTSHTYKYNNTYKVSLKITNSAGCIITHDSSIVINFTGIGISDKSKFDLNIFPNPFKNDLNVSYNLPGREYVKIEILDVLGRVVATLTNGIQASGNYQLNYNADQSHGAGMYYLRMSAGDALIIEPIIRLK